MAPGRSHEGIVPGAGAGGGPTGRLWSGTNPAPATRLSARGRHSTATQRVAPPGSSRLIARPEPASWAIHCAHSCLGAAENQRAEQVVQLLGVAQLGRRLLDDRRDHLGIERGEVVGLERQAAARRHRPRPALLQWRVVEEGVGPPVQDLLGQHRGDHRVDAVRPHLAGADLAQHLGQAVEVHRLGAAVVQRLAHDGVLGDLDRSRDVLLAGGERREDRRHEVVGLHALDGGRDAPTAAVARGDERAGQVPAPARGEHRRREHRLDQGVAHRRRREEAEHLLQREGVLRSERQHHGVVARGRLQLEVEGPQKRLRSARPSARLTLAPRGEWTTSCMPPVSSKNRSITKRSVVGSAPSSVESSREVGDHLLGDGVVDPGHLFDERDRRLVARRRPHPRSRRRRPGAFVPEGPSRRPRAGSRRPRTARRVRAGASPSQNGTARGGAFGVHDPDRARLDPADPPGGAPEEEDVAGHRLDRPVLVDSADERLLGLERRPGSRRRPGSPRPRSRP